MAIMAIMVNIMVIVVIVVIVVIMWKRQFRRSWHLPRLYLFMNFLKVYFSNLFLKVYI